MNTFYKEETLCWNQTGEFHLEHRPLARWNQVFVCEDYQILFVNCLKQLYISRTIKVYSLGQDKRNNQSPMRPQRLSEVWKIPILNFSQELPWPSPNPSVCPFSHASSLVGEGLTQRRWAAVHEPENTTQYWNKCCVQSSTHQLQLPWLETWGDTALDFQPQQRPKVWLSVSSLWFQCTTCG